MTRRHAKSAEDKRIGLALVHGTFWFVIPLCCRAVSALCCSSPFPPPPCGVFGAERGIYQSRCPLGLRCFAVVVVVFRVVVEHSDPLHATCGYFQTSGSSSHTHALTQLSSSLSHTSSLKHGSQRTLITAEKKKKRKKGKKEKVSTLTVQSQKHLHPPRHPQVHFFPLSFLAALEPLTPQLPLLASPSRAVHSFFPRGIDPRRPSFTSSPTLAVEFPSRTTWPLFCFLSCSVPRPCRYRSSTGASRSFPPSTSPRLPVDLVVG